MNSSSIPDRTGTVFASGGNYNDIAESSSTTTLAAGTATYESGFPPLTMTAISSGGIAPAGKDMNGILKDISQKLQWTDTGCGYPFNSTFASSIGGYPNGAAIPSSDLAGFWVNTKDANATSPEGTAASSTGWLPTGFTGYTSITGLASTSVTLTCLQAARKTIILSGTLTSNIYLYVPAWVYDWQIINNCTGNYNIIIKCTNSSATVAISSGISQVGCNGTSVFSVYSKTSSSGNYTIRILNDNCVIIEGTVSSAPFSSGEYSFTPPYSFSGNNYTMVANDNGQSCISYSCAPQTSGKCLMFARDPSDSGSLVNSKVGFRYIIIGNI